MLGRVRSLGAVFWVRTVVILLLVSLMVILGGARKPWTFQDIDKIQDYAAVYLWWAALLNLVPLAVLGWTAPRWLRPLPPFQGVPRAVRPRGFRWTVLAAMAVFAVLGAMRLGDGLWDDEEYAVRRAILGTYRVKEGVAKFREIPWSHTFWYYTKPTNHVFQSVLARGSLSVWRAVARPEGLPFSEAAVRFPSYLAGILAIWALAALMAEAGMAWEGALAGWILALHPWFLRLAPEARGYGLVMLLIPLTCLAAMRAINDGRWRWWAALGFCEFALLLTWPPALLTLVVINLCLVLRLLLHDGMRSARPVLAGRWLVASTVSAMAFFQLFLPCLPQFRNYMESGNSFRALGFWLKNVGSQMLTGAHWSKTGSLHPPYLETYPVAAAAPVLFGMAAAAAVAAVLLGVFRLCRTGNRGRFLTAVFLVAGPIMVAMASLQQTYLYEWYVSFMMPGLAALAAAGVLWFARGGMSRVVLAVGTLAVFAAVSAPARAFLVAKPVQSIRESVLLTRPSLDPADPRNRDILTAATVGAPEIYDPLVVQAKTLDDYRRLMVEADRRGVPLYINNGFALALRVKRPDIVALLDDDRVFEHVARLHAIEEMLDRDVHRYRPGAVELADWETYRKNKGEKPPDSVPLYYY